jgi:hypothetical protein
MTAFGRCDKRAHFGCTIGLPDPSEDDGSGDESDDNDVADWFCKDCDVNRTWWAPAGCLALGEPDAHARRPYKRRRCQVDGNGDGDDAANTRSTRGARHG